MAKTQRVPKVRAVQCLNKLNHMYERLELGEGSMINIGKALDPVFKNHLLSQYVVHSRMKDLNFEELFKGSL